MDFRSHVRGQQHTGDLFLYLISDSWTLNTSRSYVTPLNPRIQAI
jgi:hypothetical protein